MRKIGRLSEFRDGTITKITSVGDGIVIVRDGTSVRAFAAHCPHAGAPLEQGAVCNHRLICPWHKATFCLQDGTVVEPPALDRLARHAIEIDGEDVLVSPSPIDATHDVVSPSPIDATHDVGRIDGRQVLILGSGAGGTAAAVALRDAGFSGTITLIGEEALEPYDRTVLSKFVLNDMPASEVPSLRPPEYWKSQRIERLEAKVVGLDAAGKKVRLSDGTELSYDTAVLATGATANLPNIPGVRLSGVYPLRTRQDAAYIVASARPGAQGRSRETVGLLHPSGRGGAGVQDPQRRSGRPAGVPPKRSPGRGTYLYCLPDCLPGLQPARNARSAVASIRSGSDAARPAGRLRRGVNDRCARAHD
jgi:nitrite reductase/ring-hydroxylating ferredoxin subunit